MGFSLFNTGTVSAHLHNMYQAITDLEQYSADLATATRLYQSSMQDEVFEQTLTLITQFDAILKNMREICKEKLHFLEEGLNMAAHIEGTEAHNLSS